MAKRKDADPDLMASVCEHDEERLAQMIGLKRGIIAEARERVDQGMREMRSGTVLYSRAGVEQLVRELGMTQPDVWLEELLKRSRISEQWESENKGLRRVRVNCIPQNKSLVLGMLLDDPDRQTVRVLVGEAWQGLYTPGMELCVRLATAPDFYEAVGARPKQRGAW